LKRNFQKPSKGRSFHLAHQPTAYYFKLHRHDQT